MLAICAAVVAYVVALFMPKQYKSESSLYFPAQAGDSGGGLSGLKEAARAAGLGGGNADKGASITMLGGLLSSPQVASGPQTAIAVLDSNLCRQRVVDQLDLKRKWNAPNKKALKRLEGSVSLSVDKNGLLAMEATDQDPHIAQQILSAYIETLEKLATDLSLNIATKNRKFLEKRVAASRSRIAVIQQKLLFETQSDPNYLLSIDASDAVKGIVDLESELIKANVSLDAATRGLEFATEKARAVIKAGTDLPMQTEVGKDARTKLADLEYAFAIAQSQLGPDNPEYIRTKNQLAQARLQYRQEIGRQTRALDKGIAPEILKLSADKEAYAVQAASLTRALNDIKTRMNSVPRRQMRRTILERELRMTAGLLEFQTAELEKARIAEDRDETSFITIDVPDLADDPFAPRKGFTALMAGVAGLLIGVAFLVAKSSLRPDPIEFEPLEREVAVV